MGALTFSDILSILEDIGIPTGLTGLSVLFLAFFMRNKPQEPEAPKWAKAIYEAVDNLAGEHRQLAQKVDSASRVYHRQQAEHREQLRRIEGKVSSCQTLLFTRRPPDDS